MIGTLTKTKSAASTTATTTMTGAATPLDGTLGNLTAEQEQKLQQAWTHLLRLCQGSANNLNTGAMSTTPEKSTEFLQHMTDKTPEGFSKTLWAAIRAGHPDALVLRYMRARKWDVEKAVVMLVSSISWRNETDIEEAVNRQGEAVVLKEELSEDDKGFAMQYRSGKSYVRGVDKENRPIYIIKVRLHDPSLQTTKAMETFVLHNIESIGIMITAPYDKACLIFDMTGFGLKNMDFHVVRFLTQVFESKYPETLGLVLIHNAPFVFWGIWSIIKGWLDPVIASKINFTRSNADVQRFIDKNNLQACYGGTDTWEYNYIEPEAGENERHGHEEKKATILEERTSLLDHFIQGTTEWAALEPDSNEGKEKNAKRNETATKLGQNYWVIDPYIRARSLYDRAGVVNEKGEVDFQAAT